MERDAVVTGKFWKPILKSVYFDAFFRLKITRFVSVVSTVLRLRSDTKNQSV